MTDQELLQRVTCDPTVMVGKPVIRGTRLTVDYVLNLLAHGSTVDEILGEYDGLKREDIQAALLFAARSLANTAFMPLVVDSA
ncbi:MAG: hypothetical protein A2W31_02815 [Planctomycetes bacterium RBG_16_64_10]|nr:MAG: hypothetical protein A2W31_02815 [Planctomycetes bacterium RBG_16_64_10]